MPASASPQFDTLVSQTQITLRRADKEREKYGLVRNNYANFLRENARLAIRITKTQRGQVNMMKLADRATKLGIAYTKSYQALGEYAQASDQLFTTNLFLSLCYAAVAAGKVFDVIASITGTGKWITSAKTSILDAVDAARTKDETMGAGAGMNLALIAAKETEVLAGAAELQTGLSAILSLAKDLKTILSAKKDLTKVKNDLGQWTATLNALCAKMLDAASKLTKLYETYDALMKRLPPPAFKIIGEKAYRARISDYLSVAKNGIEAAINLYQMVNSILDSIESWQASTAATTQADRQMNLPSTVHFNLELEAVAGLSDGQLLDVIHNVNSFPVANQLAHEARAQVNNITLEAQEVKATYLRMVASRGAVDVAYKFSLSQLQTTDRELQNMRQRVELLRSVDSVRAAVVIDLIDRERRMIGEALSAP